MPELPEVDVITERIAPRLLDSTIERVEVIRDTPKYMPGDELDAPVGGKVTAVHRRGKNILVGLDSRRWFVVHNAMTGYWDFEDDPWTFDYVEGKREATSADVRIVIDTSAGRLRFHDLRLFGSVRCVDETKLAAALNKLGPEPIYTSSLLPLAPFADPAEFIERCRRAPDRMIKRTLMDPTTIVGIGNIYAAESLWSARIDPTTPCSALSNERLRVLLEEVRVTLYSAIIRRLDYSELKVYKRDSCQCGAKISMVEIDKRSSYYCPVCQTGGDL